MLFLANLLDSTEEKSLWQFISWYIFTWVGEHCELCQIPF